LIVEAKSPLAVGSNYVNENMEIDKSDVFGGLQLRVQQNKEK